MSPNVFRHPHMPGHGLGFHFSSRSNSPHSQPDLISGFKQIEEETLPKYNANSFYPATVGEVLDDRYQILMKLGFGATATVWLCKDVHASPRKPDQKYVTIKISLNTSSDGWLDSRREIAQRLVSANPKHPGYGHVRFLLDRFTIKGPHGRHVCIVYDVLREPIDLCKEKWPGHLFNGARLKLLLPALLQGLDYLHSECRVVHTDLKPDNIMMGLGGSEVLERVVADEEKHPSRHKAPDSHGRIIYESRTDFGEAPTDLIIATAKIIDIGLAVWGDQKHNHSIQSNAFTAPEVILTAGWSYPADIWNLGVMLWDLFENFGLFDAIDTSPGRYHPEQHLGLMIGLMGPPPKKLLARGSTSATYFDNEDNFRHPKLIPTDFTFESSITRLGGKSKELFVDFAKKMICWLPEERWTAKQLLTHPWLTAKDEDGEIVTSISSLSLTADANAEGTTEITTGSAHMRTNTTQGTVTATVTETEMKTSESSEDLIRAILNRK